MKNVFYFKNEIWKDIENYEGLYQVSNLGRIKSLHKRHHQEEHIIIQKIKRGYYQVGLTKNGKRKWHQVHRLIAQAFIPNPNNFPQVNHKDENKLNNSIENLEFCTASYNNTYGTRIQRVAEKTSKKIIQYDLNNNFIKEYKSITEAGKENNLDISSIVKCCKGKYKTYKNFIWKYKEVV